MDTQTITLERQEARALYRKYREHQHYSTPIDWEIQRIFQLIAQGKVIVQAIDSIIAAGLDDKGLPKLAIVRADAPLTFWRPNPQGGGEFRMDAGWPRNNEHRSRHVRIPDGTWPVPGISRTQQAQTPLVPIHLRPKRGLQNYHILFEADWTMAPPVDPLLLRRIGQADLWVVLAAWDLGPIERAVLAGRIAP
jgi:hypothetical protein